MYNRKGHGTQEPNRLSFLFSLPCLFFSLAFSGFRTTDNQWTISQTQRKTDQNHRSSLYSINVDFTMHTHTSFPSNVNEHEVGVDTRRSKVICIVFPSFHLSPSLSSLSLLLCLCLLHFPPDSPVYSTLFRISLSFIHSFSRCFPVICACTGNLSFITD